MIEADRMIAAFFALNERNAEETEQAMEQAARAQASMLEVQRIWKEQYAHCKTLGELEAAGGAKLRQLIWSSFQT